MSTLTLHRAASANAFADLEARLRALVASGDRIAEATMALRASAKVFAAASARLRQVRGVKRVALRVVR